MPDTLHAPGGAAALRAANGRLRQLLRERDAQTAELRTVVAVARVRASSKNSSRPPSSDGLGKPTPKSLRKKTGRGPGRPEGQPGTTLKLADRPDRVIWHEPGCCTSCGAGLSR